VTHTCTYLQTYFAKTQISVIHMQLRKAANWWQFRKGLLSISRTFTDRCTQRSPRRPGFPSGTQIPTHGH